MKEHRTSTFPISTNFNFVEKKHGFCAFISFLLNNIEQNDVLFMLPSQSMIVQLKMENKNGIKNHTIQPLCNV